MPIQQELTLLIRTSPPTVKLCTMTPSGWLDRRSRPTVGCMDSVGWLWFGSSRQAKLAGLQPISRVAPERTRTLPFTVRLDVPDPVLSFSANAASRAEPGLSVRSPLTTAAPALTSHAPRTTTAPCVPVSTPGAVGVPEQVVVPLVAAAPAAVTAPAASTPPMTALVNTTPDKLRRHPLMTLLLPFSPVRVGYIAPSGARMLTGQ